MVHRTGSEIRRYELPVAERLCRDCGNERQEIGTDVSNQYDYKPAEVFVIEHQQVMYACRCCEGQVVQAAKPALPIEQRSPNQGNFSNRWSNRIALPN